MCKKAWKEFYTRLTKTPASNESFEIELSNIKDDNIFPRKTFMNVNKVVPNPKIKIIKVSNKVINKSNKKAVSTKPIYMSELFNMLKTVSASNQISPDKNLELYRWTNPWELFTYNKTTGEYKNIINNTYQ